MSTEMNTQGAGFEDEAGRGELLISDLPSTATRPPVLQAQFEDEEDEEEGEGIVTTQMLGEEASAAAKRRHGRSIRTTSPARKAPRRR